MGIKDRFLEALVKLNKVIDRKNHVVVYSGVQLVSKDGELSMLATDGNYFVKAFISGAWDGEDFMISFDPKPLINFVKKFCVTEFDLEYSETNHELTVIGKNNQRFTIGSLNESKELEIDNNSYLESLDYSSGCEMDVGISVVEFLNGMKFLKPFMSKEETRYYLNGMYVDGDNGNFVATDGHAMGVYRTGNVFDIPKIGNDNGFIIPRETVEFVIREFRSEDQNLDHEVFVVKNSKAYAFFYLRSKIGAIYLIRTNFIDGNFPDYNRVIPDTDKMPKAAVNGDDMREKIKDIKSMGIFETIEVILEGNEMKMISRGKSEKFKSKFETGIETCEVQTAEKISVGFYLDNLIRLTNSFGNEVVEFWFDPEGPCRATSGAKDIVIMPMRLR